MAKQNSVIIDPGHGGSDPGAVYGNRREKDDTLALSYDIGNALERRGVRVEYTRVGDVYNSPYEKAQIGNSSTADLFLSIHRNAMAVPGSASGTLSLIFGRGGDAETFAENINKKLAAVGWNDLGISERPNLVVLRDTALPAVLVEVGFIDNAEDNKLFDTRLDEIAQAIADGIMDTLTSIEDEASDGQPAAEKPVDRPLYRVQVGAFYNLQNAIDLEQELKRMGYNTWIVTA